MERRERWRVREERRESRERGGREELEGGWNSGF